MASIIINQTYFKRIKPFIEQLINTGCELVELNQEFEAIDRELFKQKSKVLCEEWNKIITQIVLL